ncbi:acyltransferase [Actinocrinis sp.]|uniref:acyltransferase family protein n=1 Tax=Actinocrinis sp. TaxID=1920516 RepID=UPI002BF2A466|nr:acyltransferase [Actinocrinis sp.]HXR72582.1 acyltransferase [Actinocrinis sp.]
MQDESPLPESPRPAGAGTVASRLPSLTGMRIIAAGMVFFFHAGYEAVFADHTTQNVYTWIFGQGGWTGVGFFFILSGFVLTWSARPADTARRFWRRRFFKIYPNHFVTFLAALLLLTLAAQPIGTGRAFLNLFLLQAWSPNLSVEVSVNPVAWSLSCEALFYLSFPLLLSLIGRIRVDRLWYWAGGITAVVWCIPLISMLLPSSGAKVPFGPITQWQFWLVYVAPPVRLLDFTLGIVLARLVKEGRWIRLGLAPAFVLLAGGYFLPHLLPWSFRLVAAPFIPLGLVICAGATADVRGTRSPLRSKVMVWLGDVSFALYLWHRLILRYGHRLFGGATKQWAIPGAIGMLLFALAVTLLLSWLLHSRVEMPIMRRWSKPRSRTAPLPVTVPLPHQTVQAEPAAATAVAVPAPET